MRISGVFTNIAERVVVPAAARPVAAEPSPPVPRGCRYARDTGVRAFVNLPCRGNRIECQKTGISSFAAACRSDKCKFYEEND